MHYSFNPITISITSITIAITSITCITVSGLSQCPSLPSPSPSCLSHALQLHSYNNVHRNRHHVYHMHYSFNPIPMSITSTTIAITFITCITASILKQYPSSSPSRLSHVLHLRSYNNDHHFHNHRHNVCHMHYSLNPITMSIIIANTSITCITFSNL